MTWTRAAAIVCVLPLAACMSEPIEWDAARDIPGTIGATTRLVMDAHGNPNFIHEHVSVVTASSHACEASVTATSSRGRESYAAWFVPRPDNSVVLIVGRSIDAGATWSAHIADDRDRGQRGCSRPPPTIEVDWLSGYVHLAYFLEPDEGAGVWYAHSMERGTVWHQRVGVLYGQEPVSVSIASAGDTVLVAYEHPGSGGTRIGLAISRQAGHTFAERLRVVRVHGSARNPRIALRDGRVALAWTERAGGADGSGASRTRVRLGRLR